MNIIYFLLSALSGAGSTLQAGINGELRSNLGSPILASLISFLVGTVALSVAYAVGIIAGLQTVPSLEAFRHTQWWMWMGGLFGALFVFTTIIAPPKIGYANMFCLLIAGQLLLAIIFDHFGLFGNTVHTISTMRAVGALMLIVSVYIIQTN